MGRDRQKLDVGLMAASPLSRPPMVWSKQSVSPAEEAEAMEIYAETHPDHMAWLWRLRHTAKTVH